MSSSSSQLLKQSLKLALIQLSCTADKPANLVHARKKVLEAAARGANLIVLPECFNSPYGTQYFARYAEQLRPSPPTEAQSPTFHALSAMAREAQAYLVGGSIPEVDGEEEVDAEEEDEEEGSGGVARSASQSQSHSHSQAQAQAQASTDSAGSTAKPRKKKPRLYNTSLLFSPTGSLLATHRKVHLFDISIPGKITFRESDVLTAGNKITLVDLPPYGKIALAICYDIRFPELATIAARKGAFLLLYPGAFNTTTGALHWELQARARAMDNQVYVGVCSPARSESAEYKAWGYSMAVGPNADVLGTLDEHEGTLEVRLEEGRIEEVRRGIPLYTQRRFDVYPDVSEGGKFEED